MKTKKKVAKDAEFMVRMTPEMHDAFRKAVETANTLPGQYDEQSMASVIRQLCADYIEKMRVIAESEVARHASKVLRGARRAG